MFQRAILMALLCCLAIDRGLGNDRLNVLFIAVDDMRAWAGYLGDSVSKTPNLDRLAQSGVAFTRAYTAYALCNPSRTALMTGLRPSTSGVVSNSIDWREQIASDIPTLSGYLKQNGYRTMGAGKVFHGRLIRSDDWDEYPKEKSANDFERDDDRKDLSYKEGKSPGSFSIGSNYIEPFDGDESELEDYRTASFGIEQLGKSHGKPFFLACGFHRPHLPLVAPRKYFDAIPLSSIPKQNNFPGDLDDLPSAGKIIAKPGESATITKFGKWEECVRAYRASISFTDAQVGRLLDALEASPYRDNTLVVLWSDHGWHHGEKEHWRKSTLWEEATLSPMIWRVPNITPSQGAVCVRTVDFLSIYPTICDLCGVELPTHLEGNTIKALLSDPNAAWDRPAVSTFRLGNHAVRSERWRYIRYEDGSEELYDHESDPFELTNLASNADLQEVKNSLAQWIPQKVHSGEVVPKKKAKKIK